MTTAVARYSGGLGSSSICGRNLVFVEIYGLYHSMLVTFQDRLVADALAQSLVEVRMLKFCFA